MRPTLLVLVCCLVAGAVSAGVSGLFYDRQAKSTPTPVVEVDVLENLAATLERMQAEHASLSETVRELERRPAPDPARLDLAALDAAVDRALAARDESAGEAPPPSGKEEAEEFDKAEVFERLIEGDLTDEEASRLWKELAERGLSDELLAVFEQRAADSPGDPDVRVDLGVAYLQRIQEVGNGPMAGVYATKADRAFDAALEIDPNHWDARFTKAVALSFWPPVFGKQSAAIEQFELLLDQQASMPHGPHHAQTHLLLGNMYLQIGRREDALAAWQHGLELFPQDQDLLRQIELAGQ